MRQKQGYGYFCLVLATLFWGGNYLFGKMLSNDIAPILLNYSRWLPAAFILLLLFGKSLPQFFPIIRQNWLILTALALLVLNEWFTSIHVFIRYLTGQVRSKLTNFDE
ncbi:EamA family transporter [Pasteurella canis]|uniref:EamA family transporter n=1 Tax=Pasteurella canis TaxID=753 RepID=UPI000D828968|nr:RhaT protein [Pasteurella canis]